jgi:omega-6 fatty acid desaturase / acyl-lipid omega-6 desaturase (Delta-12 desaturase)
MYLATNASGQMRYPSGTHHYNPDAKSIFRDNQYGQIIISDIGVILWLAGMAAMIYYQGFFEFLRVYFIPYLWLV